MPSIRKLARSIASRVKRRVAGEPQAVEVERPSAETSATEQPQDGSNTSRCRPADLSMLHSAILEGGRPLLVNHWATWCDGCVEELPMLIELHNKAADKVDFLGVSWDGFQSGGDPQQLCLWVEKFAARQALPWDSLLVDAAPQALFTALDMACHTVPQIWLINAEGTVVHRVEQVLDDQLLMELSAAIDSL